MSTAEIPDSMTDNKSSMLIPEMLTIRETVERSGGKLTYSGVRRWCLENKIVHVRNGAKYLINWQRLCDYLNRGDNRQGDD